MSKGLRTWCITSLSDLGAAVGHSQWERWDEEKLYAKASGAVMGVLGGVWGGREGGMAKMGNGRISCLVNCSFGDKDHITT